MNSKTALLSAVLSALALIASNASAATRPEATTAFTPVSALTTIAKHGADDGAPIDDNGVDFVLAKHGADDPVGGEDVGCDDRGTDLCAVKLSKHGADDGAPIDDNGVDFILAKHGADDLVDGEDDHGIDFILG